MSTKSVPAVSAAEILSAFAVETRFEDLPHDVVEAAKLHLLDTIGCGLAAHSLGLGGEGRQVAADLGGSGAASVIGGDPAPAANAALANAMLCHVLDYDDTHAEAICHVGVVVGPTATAVAEAERATGKDLIAALVVGSEVMVRIGAAAQGRLLERGFHSTGVCGAFAAAATASRLSALDKERTASALGVAGSMASGIFAYLEDGTPTKPLHPGWAAHAGIVASRLASYGLPGPPSVFEGRFGFYDAYAGTRESGLDVELSDLGLRWETRRISFKPYAACHAVHGAVATIQELVRNRGLRSDEVVGITVMLPAEVFPFVAEPAEAKRAPRSAYDAKFSVHYSVAAALVTGQLGVAQFTDRALTCEPVLELAGRVQCEPKVYSSYPAAFPGGVRITTSSGRVLEGEYEFQPGCADNPLTPETVLEKFGANAELALPARAVTALRNAILSLEERQSLSGILPPASVYAPFGSAATELGVA